MQQKNFDLHSNLNYSKQPEHSEVVTDRLRELYDQGRLKDVISIGENLAERYPNSLVIFEILGAAYLGLGEEEKTIEFYQKTLKINPNRLMHIIILV